LVCARPVGGVRANPQRLHETLYQVNLWG